MNIGLYLWDVTYTESPDSDTVYEVDPEDYYFNSLGAHMSCEDDYCPAWLESLGDNTDNFTYDLVIATDHVDNLYKGPLYRRVYYFYYVIYLKTDFPADQIDDEHSNWTFIVRYYSNAQDYYQCEKPTNTFYPGSSAHNFFDLRCMFFMATVFN